MIKYKKKKYKKRKQTDIELAMSLILVELELPYKEEYYIGNYPVDFYLEEYKLSIQCDGCWVHSHPECSKNIKIYPRQIFQARRDKACGAYYRYTKTNLVRFYGCEILENKDSVIVKIIETIELIKTGKEIYPEI